MMRSATIANWFMVGLVFAAVGATSANATTLTFDLSTAGLPAGNYLFDFQFINGDTATGNNTATISDFMSTNLTLGALSSFGTVTGANLMSGVTMTDGPVTEVDQAFTALMAAANISFEVNYSQNYVPPGPGDAFTFAITDTSLNSTRSAGDGAEIEIDITGANSPVSVFSADAAFGGFEPEIQNSVATPEISTVAPSAGGLLLMGLVAARRARRQIRAPAASEVARNSSLARP